MEALAILAMLVGYGLAIGVVLVLVAMPIILCAKVLFKALDWLFD